MKQQKKVSETDLGGNVHDTVADDLSVNTDEVNAVSEDPDDALADVNPVNG